MKMSSTSDLARINFLQRTSFMTRSQLDEAAKEMTTGLKNDRYAATGGNLTRLFGLERSLERNRVFTDNLAISEQRLDVMQDGLGRILQPVQALSVDLLTSFGMGDANSAMVHARSARQTFADMIGTINTRVAGQALYSGIATDSDALDTSNAILADLDAIAQGAVTAEDALQGIEDYFTSPTGGFYTGGYLGSDVDLSAVEIGDGVRLDYALRADDDQLVATLKALGTAAVVAGGAFADDVPSRLNLIGNAGQQMLAAKEGLLGLRNQVGLSQSTVERAMAERRAEKDVFELARTRIMAVDDLEAASNFQSLEVQLQTVYAVTARIADLRFTNFMR
jgi:flagellar hook-associated protein 3 FlgL